VVSATHPHGTDDRIAGCLLGGAVGDALGLPMEGIGRRRAAKMFSAGPLRHRFAFGRGMCSDDTEHACMTARAILAHPADADAFARALAWKLRWWLLGLPAGVGLATLRAIIRLWIGVPPDRSGVRSAGNGPAMRAAIIGAYFGDDDLRLQQYIRASTRLTHSDPRAERGALLIALAAAHAARTGDANGFLELALRETDNDGDREIHQLLVRAAEHLRLDARPQEFADAIGLSRGVSGYINHTVPIALFCWLHSPRSFEEAVGSCVALGGDTDSTAAIVGALVGATAGASAVPRSLLNGLTEFPRSVSGMRRLARALAADQKPAGGSILFAPALLLRNLLFLVIVFTHGVRRLLPPY
jgi:ADP-ribosylglycohydrolase